MNQPVPVSRTTGGATCCWPPLGQATATSAVTSTTTSATAGFARSRISWADGAAWATPGTARRSVLAIHLRIVKSLYLAKYKKKAPGGFPWSLCASTAKIWSFLPQPHRLDGLRLRGVHVSGLARGLGVADQLRRITARRL